MARECKRHSCNQILVERDILEYLKKLTASIFQDFVYSNYSKPGIFNPQLLPFSILALLSRPQVASSANRETDPTPRMEQPNTSMMISAISVQIACLHFILSTCKILMLVQCFDLQNIHFWSNVFFLNPRFCHRLAEQQLFIPPHLAALQFSKDPTRRRPFWRGRKSWRQKDQQTCLHHVILFSVLDIGGMSKINVQTWSKKHGTPMLIRHFELKSWNHLRSETRANAICFSWANLACLPQQLLRCCYFFFTLKMRQF